MKKRIKYLIKWLNGTGRKKYFTRLLNSKQDKYKGFGRIKQISKLYLYNRSFPLTNYVYFFHISFLYKAMIREIRSMIIDYCEKCYDNFFKYNVYLYFVFICFFIGVEFIKISYIIFLIKFLMGVLVFRFFYKLIGLGKFEYDENEIPEFIRPYVLGGTIKIGDKFYLEKRYGYIRKFVLEVSKMNSNYGYAKVLCLGIKIRIKGNSFLDGIYFKFYNITCRIKTPKEIERVERNEKIYGSILFSFLFFFIRLYNKIFVFYMGRPFKEIFEIRLLITVLVGLGLLHIIEFLLVSGKLIIFLVYAICTLYNILYYTRGYANKTPHFFSDYPDLFKGIKINVMPFYFIGDPIVPKYYLNRSPEDFVLYILMMELLEKHKYQTRSYIEGYLGKDSSLNFFNDTIGKYNNLTNQVNVNLFLLNMEKSYRVSFVKAFILSEWIYKYEFMLGYYEYKLKYEAESLLRYLNVSKVYDKNDPTTFEYEITIKDIQIFLEQTWKLYNKGSSFMQFIANKGGIKYMDSYILIGKDVVFVPQYYQINKLTRKDKKFFNSDVYLNLLKEFRCDGGTSNDELVKNEKNKNYLWNHNLTEKELSVRGLLIKAYFEDMRVGGFGLKGEEYAGDLNPYGFAINEVVTRMKQSKEILNKFGDVKYQPTGDAGILLALGGLVGDEEIVEVYLKRYKMLFEKNPTWENIVQGSIFSGGEYDKKKQEIIYHDHGKRVESFNYQAENRSDRYKTKQIKDSRDIIFKIKE